MASPYKEAGFTLIELMLASGILVVALVGLLGSYVLCFNLEESAANLTLATLAVEQKEEEIRNFSFFDIFNQYNNSTFEISGINNADGEGSVRVDNSNPDLLTVTINACWRQRGGRIMGEDDGRGGGIALNGRLDGAEDANGNGVLDSPAQIVTLVTAI